MKIKKFILMLFVVVISGCSQQNIIKENKIGTENKTGIVKILNVSNPSKKEENKKIMNRVFKRTGCDIYNIYTPKIGKINGKIIYRDVYNRTGSIDFDTSKVRKIDKSYVITNTGVYYFIGDGTLELLSGADPNTFKYLRPFLSKDKDNIFLVTGYIEDGNDWKYARTGKYDKESYVDIKDIDIKTLESIKVPISGTNCFQEDLFLVKDKNYIYHSNAMFRIPIKIDNKSFKILHKSKDPIYFGALKNSFYFKNKNTYYKHDETGFKRVNTKEIKFIFEK